MNIVRCNAKCIVTSTWFSPELCQERSTDIFVFGDNLIRRGKGGQACIRDEPNAFGISTKVLPSTHMTSYLMDTSNGAASNKEIIDREMVILRFIMKGLKGRVIFPADGLGTGLSKMPKYCPYTLAYLNHSINEEMGMEIYKA